VALNQILCSPHARAYGEHRLFPDEIVFCGFASVFVQYTDPGLRLAQSIRQETQFFMKKYQCPPRTILLENHGIIVAGRTTKAVLAGAVMAEKAAKIWVGAAALEGPNFLRQGSAQRIAERSDEQYRQRASGL
jgi:ribulose-5-phosphate 4-epimerase/fuculose-1-phosphate aldolase